MVPNNYKERIAVSKHTNRLFADAIVIDEGCVMGAQVLPSRRGRIERWHIRDILSKDNREASIQVLVDVAMEEPRPRIVGEKPDCDVIPSVANTHDISDNRVDKVVGRATSAAYHVEIVPVQMDRVRRIRSTTGNGQLDALVRGEFVDASFRKKI